MSFRHARTRMNYAHRRGRASHVRVHDTVRYAGGLDLVNSAQAIKAGRLLAVKNYEPNFINGAYTRVGGYERFDGQPRPHLAEYWKLDLSGILGGPFTVAETVTASPSGATATVAAYTVDTDANDGSGWLTLTDLSEQVDLGEVWTGGSSGATGTATSDTEYGGFPDEDDHDVAQLAAESIRRDVITAVGGAAASGSVLGGFVYADDVYAFRNNATGSECTMWKAITTGWAAVDLGFKIRFTAGSIPLDEGDTLTGASSGASCTVERVVLTDGYWSGEDAAGYVITTSITSGPFTASENLQVGGTTHAVADATSPQEAQTLPAGGKYRFRNHNFGGNTATFRMYGVNGVGNAFEFDGSVFTLIETGMENDTPNHIGVHYGHLLLGFAGGSLQHSGKNAPLSFTPIRGANELLAGDEITGFIEEVQDVTFVFTRNKTFRLVGFIQENIQLKLHSSETGALENTVQRIGRSMYLDDRGFTSRSTTDAFGDFASNQVSVDIDPLVQSFLKNSTVSGSVIHRGKSLYRCFFSNKEAIVFGLSGNKVSGITVIDYDKTITTTFNSEIEEDGTNNGEERVFFGSDDGFMYETDVGRNFDGEVIEAYFVTAYHFSGSPEYNVRYRRCTVYIEGAGRTSMTVWADYNYNEDSQNFEEIMNEAKPLGGGRYGISRHDAFNYSSASKSDIRLTMGSHARNVSLIFYSKEANEEPHTVHAVNFHMSKRRMIRS
jgi:hypothetical protein